MGMAAPRKNRILRSGTQNKAQELAGQCGSGTRMRRKSTKLAGSLREQGTAAPCPYTYGGEVSAGRWRGRFAWVRQVLVTARTELVRSKRGAGRMRPWLRGGCGRSGFRRCRGAGREERWRRRRAWRVWGFWLRAPSGKVARRGKK